MRTIVSISVILLCYSTFLTAQEDQAGYADNWPQWRGPDANGVAPAGKPPIEWNEDLNVKWKVETPGRGHSTPIVWDEQIIILSAVQTDKRIQPDASAEDQGHNQWMSPITTDFIHKFLVTSLDRNSGKILWQTTVREELPQDGTHQFGSWASNSPVTDGVNIYAYFGSRGLYCLDFEGKILWEKDLGPMEKVMSFGEGSSPVLHESKLIILRDHQGQSTLHVLDKNTGEELWKTDRDEVSSWATPFIVEFDGRTQVITSATNKIRSYNLEDGEVIWECSGMTRNVIPSSITMDDKLYFLKVNNGYLSCLDAADGTEYYSAQKLEGIQNIFASLAGVNNHIYITGAKGKFYVVKSGAEFTVLSQNNLDDSFHASPVIIGNNLYLRGFKYLYCIAEE